MGQVLYSRFKYWREKNRGGKSRLGSVGDYFLSVPRRSWIFASSVYIILVYADLPVKKAYLFFKKNLIDQQLAIS